MTNPKNFIHEQAVTEGYLYDWYIASVTDAAPQWTDEHINELLGDFYLIPKSVVDETQPESITKKLDLNDTANIDVQIALEEEAVCEAKEAGHNNDVKYHSDILMSLWKLKRIQQEFL